MSATTPQVRVGSVSSNAESAACAIDASGDLNIGGARRRTWVATAWAALAAIVAVLLLVIAGVPELAPVGAAFLCGWLNVAGGPCAQNALTAITPLKAAAGASQALWLRSSAAYMVAGLFSSGLIGLALGAIGQGAGLSVSTNVALTILGVLAVYSLLRDGVGLPLPLPQAKRSSRAWFARFGQPTAAILWGLDVGSFFSTWLTYAGAWWLVAVAVLSGSPALAAALFAMHWLGRSAIVWAGPWMARRDVGVDRLPAMWDSMHPRFRQIYALTVLLATAAVVVA